jgi:short-subunit dehydrogenase
MHQEVCGSNGICNKCRWNCKLDVIKVSLPGIAPYDCSKFACEAFADALRTESSFWGVKVSVINPSTMKTELAMGMHEKIRHTWNEMNKIHPEGKWKSEWDEEWLEEHITTGTWQIAQIAQDPLIVAKDVVHAVSAHRPKTRYLSGLAAKTIFYWMWCLPESIVQPIKRKLINPKPNAIQRE